MVQYLLVILQYTIPKKEFTLSRGMLKMNFDIERYSQMTTEEKMKVFGWRKEDAPAMEIMVQKMIESFPKEPYQWRLMKYINHNVKITCKDGDILLVHVCQIADPDNNDGEEGIQFKQGGGLVTVLEHEIESIEILDNK